MSVDVSCSYCGREPSHPQVKGRFIYAAYYRVETGIGGERRHYVAALCEGCYTQDRRAGTSAARNRFFRHVSRWSAATGNRSRIVRLLEHPAGVTNDEWEADNCFQDGVAAPCSALEPLEAKP